MALTTEQQEVTKDLFPDFEVKDETTWDEVKKMVNTGFVSRKFHDDTVEAKKKESFAFSRRTAEAKLAEVFGEDAKGKTLDDFPELFKTKLDSMNAALEEAKKSSGGSAKDKEIIDQLTKDRDQFKKLAESSAEALQQKDELLKQKETEAEEKFKLMKTQEAQLKKWDAMNWTDEAAKNQYLKKGIWDAEIAPKYKLEMDGDKLLVRNAENGEYELHNGHPMTAETLYEQVITKTGHWKNNGAQGGNGGGKNDTPEPPTGRTLPKGWQEHHARIKDSVPTK